MDTLFLSDESLGWEFFELSLYNELWTECITLTLTFYLLNQNLYVVYPQSVYEALSLYA